jgi:hypothetical protein
MSGKLAFRAFATRVDYSSLLAMDIAVTLCTLSSYGTPFLGFISNAVQRC